MHEIVLLCLGLILTVSFLVLLARKCKVPYPIFLVIAGLALGFIPGMPTIHIDPDLIFLVILPPILFDAAQNTSWKALWKWRRIITVMALGFVLLTATAVGFTAYWLIPGFTLAQGFLLGAIISPPDAAAVTAVLQYVKLPKAIVLILEGESLLNDASSLTIFRFALAAIISSHFVWYQAVGSFFLVTLSGIAIGLLFGLIFYLIYKYLPTNSNLDVALSLVLPYLVYLSAEGLHSSGVLAVVSAGLYISYQNHFIFGHSSRLKANAIWPALIFILHAVVFFTLGLQLPDIISGIKTVSIAHAVSIALLITAVVIIIRMVGGSMSAVFTKFISRYITVAQSNPGWRNPLIVSWAGMRGVVSLASALAIPLFLRGTEPFPHRNLIIFITFVVIIVTLVGQGLLLPWLIKKVQPREIDHQKTDDQQQLEIDLELLTAASKELKDKYAEEIAANQLLKNRFELIDYKIQLYNRLEQMDPADRAAADKMIRRFKKIMILITEHERKQLHAFRHKDDYDDDVIRLVEKRLDLEEERLEEEEE